MTITMAIAPDNLITLLQSFSVPVDICLQKAFSDDMEYLYMKMIESNVFPTAIPGIQGFRITLFNENMNHIVNMNIHIFKTNRGPTYYKATTEGTCTQYLFIL
jgi:hypothetical protein